MKLLSSQTPENRGFTLIELLISISVLLVLVAAAAPSMTNMIRRNRLQATADRFVEGLSVARNEAIRRGTTLSLTRAVTGSEGDWNGGWEVKAEGTTLYSSEPLGETTIVVGTFVEAAHNTPFTSSSGLNRVSFARDGTRITPAGLDLMVVVACDVGNSVNNPYRAVLIYPSGMVQIRSKHDINFTPDPCM
jgi:prepilin-type N-terminal cleavage/methylation domain-containing protein